jgi:hypothetical protein
MLASNFFMSVKKNAVIKIEGYMKNIHLSSVLLLAVIFGAGTVYGIIIHRYEVFPYEIIKKVYHRNSNTDRTYGPWSIGIYKGPSPFNLEAPQEIRNPVITRKDVADIDAAFTADPFLISEGKKHYLFFEVFNRDTNQGDISYAESTDLATWKYKEVIIDEEFHLSFPYVFKWNSTYYLIPESHEDFSIRLYRAVDFPEKWEYIDKLLIGYRYTDNAIFRHADKWWMFVSTGSMNFLHLYFSDDLLHGWKPHPLNPIVQYDKNFSRPAGRVFRYRNKLHRLAQDDEPSYGIRVFAFEITELTEESYSERLVSEKPLVDKTGSGWNAAGMHHVDLHKIGNEWVAAVDGRDK